MEFTKSLLKGKLIKRYKRFFVDVNLNKQIVTAHCPNTGSMKGLLKEGNDVYLLKHDDPKRKLRYGLEIIKVEKNLVGINTHMANKIVNHGLYNNLIKELNNCKRIKSEVFFNKETRFDFLVERNQRKNFVEVKKSIVGKKSKVNHLSYIGDTTIGKSSNIGAGTITCNYDGVKKSKTKIKDNVFIGSNSALVAPVTIEEKSIVGAGSVITKSVKKKSLALTRSLQTEIKNYKRK